jgi:hypothetical protein
MIGQDLQKSWPIILGGYYNRPLTAVIKKTLGTDQRRFFTGFFCVNP